MKGHRLIDERSRAFGEAIAVAIVILSITAISRGAAAETVVLEAEEIEGGSGSIMHRSGTSKNRTRQLQRGQSFEFHFRLATEGHYEPVLSISNDTEPDRCRITLDGAYLAEFVVENTRPANDVRDAGWNYPALYRLPVRRLDAGSHVLQILLVDADVIGCELDVLTIAPTTSVPLRLTPLPARGGFMTLRLDGTEPDSFYRWLQGGSPNAITNIILTDQALAKTREISFAVPERLGFIRVEKLSRPEPIKLEAEAVESLLPIMERGRASGQRTRWMHQGDQLEWQFLVPIPGRYRLALRYSNDGLGDEVTVSLGASVLGTLDTLDTRIPWHASGSGWGWFDEAMLPEPIDLPAGLVRRFGLTISQADPFGVELDCILLTPAD